MENRTFDIPSFVTRTIFEFFWITPPSKYRMKLRIRFGNCSKLASKIVLRTTWLRIRKVREWFEVRETLASNIFFHSCSRAIFFITLFVMNYKVASLEIIRGSRDPVFFFYLSYPFNFEQEDEMVIRVKGSKLFRVVGRILLAI